MDKVIKILCTNVSSFLNYLSLYQQVLRISRIVVFSENTIFIHKLRRLACFRLETINSKYFSKFEDRLSL